ncbi:hypothetical protein [Flavobacterium sp.]|uniref:hypothetical protein n=1 Tax=Flavobacterium sp. TaxID=239 RepID=UPI004047A238
MTKRDFFRIIIKLFGLYSLVISLFTFVPQNISNLYIYKEELSFLFVIIGSFLLLIALFLFLLFQTDWIINKLNLTSNFDDDQIILGNLNTNSIYTFSIILIGGFMIIDNFPILLMDLINEFKLRISNYSITNHDTNYFWFAVNFLNVLFGYLLVTNCKSITKFLDKK